MDLYDDGQKKAENNNLTPLNIKKKPKNPVAVAIEDARSADELPKVTAAGRGKIAEQILQLAFENDIRVREDSALAEILASVELDSPVPTEAFMAVAEILSYVYRANGQPNPFDAILQDAMDEGKGADKDGK